MTKKLELLKKITESIYELSVNELEGIVSYIATLDKKKAEIPKMPKTKEVLTPYTLEGTSLKFGDKFIPKKVFNGITYAIKQNSGKWNAAEKCWVFPTKKELNKFLESQKKYSGE